jgi:GTP cyclohydrolase IA
MPVDKADAAKAVTQFLLALGLDPGGDPELASTPARVAEAWANDLVDGYEVDVGALLRGESSPSTGLGIVSVRDLAVSTICPHHLLPARGMGTVLYLPGARVTGVGNLAKLLDAFAHRLTLQETITSSVAASLVEHLGARGAACKLSLSHDCLSSRGERKTDAMVETVAFAGSFEQAGPDRDLAIAALGAKA